jgi:adenylate kinase
MPRIFEIILFGPQGSGKGTQAKLLSEKYHLPVLSPGEIFRREIKNQTEIGKSVASFINHGQLASDEIVNKIIIGEIKKPEYQRGFILDGYPRNITQLEMLEKFANITYAIELVISDKTVISRLSGRLTCSKCGAIYHVKEKPPKVAGICDLCSGTLYTRDDDKIEAIKKRLEIYHRETEPLLNYYFEKKILFRINSEQPIEKVFEDIIGELEKNK